MKIQHLVSVWMIVTCTATPLWAETDTPPSVDKLPISILTLDAVLTRVENGHPLLRGRQTQKMIAAAGVQRVQVHACPIRNYRGRSRGTRPMPVRA